MAAGLGARRSQVSQQGESNRTVDILPLDVQLWTYPGHQRGAEALGQTFHSFATGATVAELCPPTAAIQSRSVGPYSTSWPRYPARRPSNNQR